MNGVENAPLASVSTTKARTECNDRATMTNYDHFVALCPYSPNPTAIFTSIVPQIPLSDLQLIHSIINNAKIAHKIQSEPPHPTARNQSSPSPSFFTEYNCSYIFNAPPGGDEIEAETQKIAKTPVETQSTTPSTQQSTSSTKSSSNASFSSTKCIHTTDSLDNKRAKSQKNMTTAGQNPTSNIGSMSNIDTASTKFSIDSRVSKQSQHSVTQLSQGSQQSQSQSQGSLTMTSSELIPNHLPIEPNKGPIEYKLIFSPSHINRIDQLVTQLTFRLQQGSGVAMYALGVDDYGIVRPPSCSSLHTPFANFFTQTTALYVSLIEMIQKLQHAKIANTCNTTECIPCIPSEPAQDGVNPNVQPATCEDTATIKALLKEKIDQFNSLTKSIGFISMVYMYYLVLQLNTTCILQQNLIDCNVEARSARNIDAENHATMNTTTSSSPPSPHDFNSNPAQANGAYLTTNAVEQPYFYTLHYEYVLPYCVDILDLTAYEKSRSLRPTYASHAARNSIQTQTQPGVSHSTSSQFMSTKSTASGISSGYGLNPEDPLTNVQHSSQPDSTATTTITIAHSQSQSLPSFTTTPSDPNSTSTNFTNELDDVEKLVTYLVLCKIRREPIPRSYLTYNSNDNPASGLGSGEVKLIGKKAGMVDNHTQSYANITTTACEKSCEITQDSTHDAAQQSPEFPSQINSNQVLNCCQLLPNMIINTPVVQHNIVSRRDSLNSSNNNNNNNNNLNTPINPAVVINPITHTSNPHVLLTPTKSQHNNTTPTTTTPSSTSHLSISTTTSSTRSSMTNRSSSLFNTNGQLSNSNPANNNFHGNNRSSSASVSGISGMFSFVSDKGGNGMSEFDQKNIALWFQWYFSLSSITSQGFVNHNPSNCAGKIPHTSFNQTTTNNKYNNDFVQFQQDDSNDGSPQLSPLTPYTPSSQSIFNFPRVDSLGAEFMSLTQHKGGTGGKQYQYQKQLHIPTLAPLTSQTPQFSPYSKQGGNVHETDGEMFQLNGNGDNFHGDSNLIIAMTTDQHIQHISDSNQQHTIDTSDTDSFFNDIVVNNTEQDDDDDFFNSFCSGD